MCESLKAKKILVVARYYASSLAQWIFSEKKNQMMATVLNI